MRNLGYLRCLRFVFVKEPTVTLATLLQPPLPFIDSVTSVRKRSLLSIPFLLVLLLHLQFESRTLTHNSLLSVQSNYTANIISYLCFSVNFVILCWWINDCKVVFIVGNKMICSECAGVCSGFYIYIHTLWNFTEKNWKSCGKVAGLVKWILLVI